MVKKKQKERYIKLAREEQKKYESSINEEEICKTIKDNTIKSIKEKFAQAGIRCEADLRNEKLGYKIREAQLEKTPYMLIVGEKEEATDTVSIRSRKEGDMGSKALSEFIPVILEEIETKAH